MERENESLGTAAFVLDLIGKAQDALGDACKRGRITMCVPVQPTDHDVVIANALAAAKGFIETRLSAPAAPGIREAAEECRHEGIAIPEPQDEAGRRAQFPARVRCPDCGADVEIR